MYKPEPIDTSDIELSADILEIVEKLARNTHEVWAKGRIDEGWVYGEKRDDKLKHHPCIVEYDKLSETEKDYDRNTSLETIKLILKYGYTIKKEK